MSHSIECSRDVLTKCFCWTSLYISNAETIVFHHDASLTQHLHLHIRIPTCPDKLLFCNPAQIKWFYIYSIVKAVTGIWGRLWVSHRCIITNYYLVYGEIPTNRLFQLNLYSSFFERYAWPLLSNDY